MSDLSERIAKLSPEKRALLEQRMRSEKAAPGREVDGIAVIGIGCRLPGGVDSPQSFWKLLVDGVDAISEVPPERWDVDALYDPDATVRGKMATRWGGFLDHIEEFDPPFFELTDREAQRMDPQQRLFLETTWSALEDAGLIAKELAGSTTGVFVAAHNMNSDYFVRQTYALEDIDGYSATGGAHSIVANRVSYWLDLQGPSMTVDTACSGSLVAAHLAVNSLRAGECDIAIAGGVNLMLTPESTIALSGLQMMASDGRCKTFDARADGFVRGEGSGTVILKRLADAQRDGDAIYAVIRGSAINQDGRTNGLTAPNGLSQQRVVGQALRQAAVDGNRIGFVETHGTGTAMGDPIEVEALAEVMGHADDGLRCAIGSVKTNIGHLESAAGIAGLIKAVLSLHHEYIPPNLHFTELNPHIDLSSTRFVVPTEGLPWPPAAESRLAGVSSFGFGGTNAHMVLEEALGDRVESSRSGEPPQEAALLVSARDRGGLEALAAAYAGALLDDDLSFDDVCFTAACRRGHHQQRLAVLASDSADAARLLTSFVDGEPLPGVVEGRAADRGARPTTFVFSGQGSQRVGMGRTLLESEPVFREAIERIDDLLSERAGWSLLDVLQNADEERLSNTEIAQPAIFAVQVGLAELLHHYGITPDAVVGHSLGEVAAAAVAGALSLEDAVTVICHRGKLMQRLHGAGRMAAISAPAEQVERLLDGAHESLSIAAINGPFSVTVSGEPEAIEALVAGLDVPHQVLPVMYAFHSSQMSALQAELEQAVSDIRVQTPKVAVYSTVRGGRAEPGDFGPGYWARNIREPVNFAGAIEASAADGSTCFLEVGPQAVLGPPVEQCLEAGRHDACVLGALLRNKPERIVDVLAAAHVNGLPVAWNKRFRGVENVVRLPSYQWQRRRCWFEPTRDRLSAAQAGPDVADWGYELAWPLRTPLADWAARLPVSDRRALDAISARVADTRDTIYAKHGAEDSVPLVDALQEKAVEYAAGALQALGFALASGGQHSTEEVTAVADGYRQRIVKRLFGLLEDHGIVSREGDVWTVDRDPPAPGGASDSAQRFAGGPEVFTLLERCGQKVADVVKGQTDPLSLLFPGDYTTSAEWVYADAPFSRVANDLVGETVTALVDTLADNRTLRVLEIGAGTGGTTREVLPRLDQERTEYVFTDLSQSFLKQASERFHANLPLHGKVLDVETDPAAQGFDDGQFDLIIAANVIHATADLKQSLVHARQLLAPGGVLLMLEGTARRGWIDLTFGLTEGWWRFTDTDVRTDHPLLDTDGWLSLLSASGYDDVAAIPVERDSNGCIFEQAILLARAPLDETTAKPELAIDDKAPWIVFTDNHGVGAGLARLLESHATPCIVVEQTDTDGSNGDGQYRVNPTRRQDFVESLEAITRKSGSQPGAVVHLFGTNENVEGGAVDWDASMTRSCGSALHLIQAMDETGVQPERGLWIATRGAQAVAAHDGETSVAQAPLWGLGRVAAREKPDLWGGLVDLDVEADPDRDAAGLLSVVVNHRDENQVALRGTDRFVARYLEKSLDPAAPAAFADDRSYLIVGGTGGIGLKMAQWMVERGARHLTLQSRRGRPADDDVQAAGIVSDLESAGAQVSFVAADSADAARMAEVFAEFGAEKPELAGVIHTAAVIDFQPIEEIGLEDYLAAVRAKVAGSWVLHELTAPLELDFLLLFSSMAAIAGFPQLSHYAAGNCFLDALAHRRRELGLPATSINWGLWSEGRSTSDENKQLFESIGLRAMASDKALQGLERALASGSVQETVAWVDWGAFRPIYESRGASRLLSRLPERAEATSAPEPAADEVQASRFRSELAAADPVAAERMVEDAVSKAVAAILGLGENAVPPRSEGFFQLGMDSIMSVELRRRLESKLQVQLPTTLAFEYPTIEALTGYLVAEVLGIGTSEADPGPAAAKPPEPAEEEDDLDEFSDAELAAELDRELAQLSEGDGGVS